MGHQQCLCFRGEVVSVYSAQQKRALHALLKSMYLSFFPHTMVKESSLGDDHDPPKKNNKKKTMTA